MKTLEANFGPKYYRGGSFAGTAHITDIPMGMNGLPVDSAAYTHVCGHEAVSAWLLSVLILTASKFMMVCPVSRYTESRKRTLVNVVGYTEKRKKFSWFSPQKL